MTARGAPTNTRAPGSFSPMPSSQSTRPPLRRVSSSSSDSSQTPLTIAKRGPPPSQATQNAPAPPRPLYASSISNSSSSSLQNFSRPTPTPLRTDLSRTELGHASSASPLTPRGSSSDFHRGHGRKHSHTAGSFEPYLPTAANSNLGSMAHANPTPLSASQIAAQAAMHHQMHTRQRSQTVPAPQMGDHGPGGNGSRKPSRAGPISPPLLSLTEASAPRDNAFGGQVYYNGLLGGPNTNAAHTAANVVFPKSPGSSPGLPPIEYEHQRMHPDKPIKTEKSKVKLFSRPGKIGISKDKGSSSALPSPSKMASFTLHSLQRNNFSTNSLADSMSSAASMYSMANSSSATIRGADVPPEKEKDKHKHHFLSRQKHKLTSKDDHHLPLSSAASNSKPVDPSAPSSLYNFNLPPSPGPTSTSFSKSVSGLDLRHGGRALRERKKEEKSESMRENELSYQNSHEWPGPSSLGSASALSHAPSTVSSHGYPASLFGSDERDPFRIGLGHLTPDDAWPYLKAKMLVMFEGEGWRAPIEDVNVVVTMYLQRCISKRLPNLIVDDFRDLLSTGFSSLDMTLRTTPDDRLIPELVSMWMHTFTKILPYMQAVFLPLDLEFCGNGTLMSPDAARDFWGVLPSASSENGEDTISAAQVLEVRKIVLLTYRDTVILPRFDTLKTIFSRLSLESISLPVPASDILSTSPDSFSGGRPSTAMSLDPATASYGSQATTLLGETMSGSRSRAISNVSYGSDPSTSSILNGNSMPPPPARPFTPSSTHPMHPLNRERGQRRDQTVEDSSKRLTETVGRMLQCMSVLASVGVGGGAGGDEDSQQKMEELTRGLKLNWLGRGRMGRDRRGLVGARVVVGARGLQDGISASG